MTVDNGGRAHDPDRVADALDQLERGSFRFIGENPANSSNVETCNARPRPSCSRPDGSPTIAWLDTYTPPTIGQRCDGGTP